MRGARLAQPGADEWEVVDVGPAPHEALDNLESHRPPHRIVEHRRAGGARQCGIPGVVEVLVGDREVFLAHAQLDAGSSGPDRVDAGGVADPDDVGHAGSDGREVCRGLRDETGPLALVEEDREVGDRRVSGLLEQRERLVPREGVPAAVAEGDVELGVGRGADPQGRHALAASQRPAEQIGVVTAARGDRARAAGGQLGDVTEDACQRGSKRLRAQHRPTVRRHPYHSST